MLKSLFTFPYYHSTVQDYNKDDIINTALDNYEEQPSRNKWNAGCDLHHSNLDECSQTQLDLSTVYDQYVTHTRQFLKELGAPYYQFELDIANYTVTTDIQSMMSHHHYPALFTGIHYIKYNPKVHKPTQFDNPSILESVLKPYTEEASNFPNNFLANWMYSSVELPDIQEDSIIITPGYLSHSLPPSHSDEPRISIVFNITPLSTE
jgi:hypothetical protein